MKFLAFAAAALLAASPGLATQRHRVAAGGDPDLDLTVRPRGEVTAQPGPDDNVYLPGLTEPAGAVSAADISQYKGQGGPLEEIGYPPCSATVTDRCIEVNNPALSRASVSRRGRPGWPAGGRCPAARRQV